MGWSSGLPIFDAIVKAILDDESITDPQQEELIAAVIDAFEDDTDWDTESDSAYFDHPFVSRHFRKLFPEWFREES